MADSPTPITIASQFQTILQVVQPYVQQLDAGIAIVCADLVHLWANLWKQSQKTRILIMFNGEDIRGPFATASVLSRVDRKFLVVVSRGRSYNVTDRGAPLYEGIGNELPLFTVVEQVRDILRGIQWDTTWCENPDDYKGIIPFGTPPGIVIDALQIEFSIGTNLPPVSATQIN